jgi:hypothetical protein
MAQKLINLVLLEEFVCLPDSFHVLVRRQHCRSLSGFNCLNRCEGIWKDEDADWNDKNKWWNLATKELLIRCSL